MSRVPGAVLLGLALGSGLLAAAPSARADEDAAHRRAVAMAREVEKDLVDTLDRVRFASVSILTKATRAPGSSAGHPVRPLPLTAVGSGVLVRYRGVWVLTNEHVVATPDRLEVVTSDGRRHAVRVRARDRRSDLALLAFEERPPSLSPIPLEDRRIPVAREGAWVIATGNPFFLAVDGREAASLGVVSGMRPADAEAYVDVPTIQHDAEINPGSSGGPLFDVSGNLLGINGTIATRSRTRGAGPSHTGASFTVPMDRVQAFLASSLGTRAPTGASRSGRGTTRTATTSAPAPGLRTRTRAAGFLGIRYRTSRDRGGSPVGALVTGVYKPSPAAAGPGRSGLQPGDVITRLGAHGTWNLVREANDVQRVLARLSPGSQVSVRFTRDGRTYDWSGRLATRAQR